ncbi:MAG TPA: hypothetical protein VK541_14735 [Pedobacter sp.]|uniref:hypothetical protein n=1 Tax=Pedobacter sp. TaxID=1411316 RepID=UPI002CAB3988|nr:hypothetical protein [Pedobacter sp.]HMI03737.1 hypothetical protein [Pedobacter sp.]
MADKWKGISGVAQKADPSGKFRWNFGENGICTPITEESRTPIPVVPGDLVIDWQTDIVPDDPSGRIYVQRFGNIIQDIINVWDDSGTMRKNSPEWYYTMTGDQITTVTINTLFAGTISIL